MKFMPVREFLRGGYKKITEPTIVSNRGAPLFTVYPAVDSSPKRSLKTFTTTDKAKGEVWNDTDGE